MYTLPAQKRGSDKSLPSRADADLDVKQRSSDCSPIDIHLYNHNTLKIYNGIYVGIYIYIFKCLKGMHVGATSYHVSNVNFKFADVILPEG